MSGASTAERAPTGALHATPEAANRTIVVGLGNPILRDDGAGWLVADAVEAALTGRDEAVVVERLAAGGLTLMEHLVGFRRAILVDAVVTGADPPGTVRRLSLDALPGREAGHLDSAHDATLAAALEAGRALGAVVPDSIDIVTIEAVRVLDVGEALTPDVEDAVQVAADLVLGLLAGSG